MATITIPVEQIKRQCESRLRIRSFDLYRDGLSFNWENTGLSNDENVNFDINIPDEEDFEFEVDDVVSVESYDDILNDNVELADRVLELERLLAAEQQVTKRLTDLIEQKSNPWWRIW